MLVTSTFEKLSDLKKKQNDKSEKNINWWQTVVRKTTLTEISYFFILMEGVVSLKKKTAWC